MPRTAAQTESLYFAHACSSCHTSQQCSASSRKLRVAGRTCTRRKKQEDICFVSPPSQPPAKNTCVPDSGVIENGVALALQREKTGHFWLETWTSVSATLQVMRHPQAEGEMRSACACSTSAKHDVEMFPSFDI